jgi:tetratricopeptide (TPR) repeat protein
MWTRALSGCTVLCFAVAQLQGDYNQALDLFERGDYAGAAVLFQESLRFDKDANTYFNLGNTYMRLNQWDDAIRAFKECQKLGPHGSELVGNCHFNEGVVYRTTYELEKAVKAFKRAVTARPTFERAYSVLGYTYYEMHNLQESLASYEKAISIAPKYMDVYNNMLATLAHMQLYARGVETGKTLLRHQPNDMSATIQTAVLHECAGELKEALRLLRRARSMQAEQGARGLHRMSNSYLNVAICAMFDDLVDDKIRLQKHLANLDRAFPGQGFHVLPAAFELPLERQAFEREYSHSSGGSGSLWIVKPAEAANGAGVRLLESLSNLPPEHERWLVQRYIERPLLLDGRKFDMRLFALVTNVWPLRIYLFPDGASCAAQSRVAIHQHRLDWWCAPVACRSRTACDCTIHYELGVALATKHALDEPCCQPTARAAVHAGGEAAPRLLDEQRHAEAHACQSR